MNCFRCTQDGSLDRKYMRLAAVHRLLRKRIIGQARALELLAQRHNANEMTLLRRTVELWEANHMKNMLP